MAVEYPVFKSLTVADGVMVGTNELRIRAVVNGIPSAPSYRDVVVSVALVNLDTSDISKSAGVGSVYGGQLMSTGGDGQYTYSIWYGSLPSGLTLNPSTGRISGIPSALGTSEIGVRVDSGGSSDVEIITIHVFEEALGMWFEGAVDIDTNTAIELVFHGEGGAGEPYTYSVPSITPSNYPELTYDSVIEYIYGYIRTAGTYTIPVTIRDSVGGFFTKNLVFTVSNPTNSFDGQQFTASEDDFNNKLDGGSIDPPPDDSIDAGSF